MFNSFSLVAECLDFAANYEPFKKVYFAVSPFVFKVLKSGEKVYERLVVVLEDGDYRILLQVIYLNAECTLPEKGYSLELESVPMSDPMGWTKIVNLFVNNCVNFCKYHD